MSDRQTPLEWAPRAVLEVLFGWFEGCKPTGQAFGGHMQEVGGFNGFEVGPVGMLYGPLWFKGQVVKIDPANGAVTIINSQFQTPAAANLDGKGNLWVIDIKTGELSKVELATGRKTVMKQLKTAIDKLAIAPDGTIYVSNMADNGIDAYNPATGEVRNLTSGKLALPAGLRYADGSLYVADIFAFRKVDASSGTVTDLARMQASDMEYPFGVGISKTRITLTSWQQDHHRRRFVTARRRGANALG
jgi:DNA-binding beta-propeller fold protein YncE